MAYCKPTTTTRNTGAAMRYCCEKQGKKRDGVESRGVGCSDQWRTAEKQMKIARQIADQDKGAQAHLAIISFDPAELKGKDGLQRALDICEEIAKETWPDSQLFLAGHQDNKNGITHVHVIVNNLDGKGKKLSTTGELNKFKKITNAKCKEHGLSVIKPKERANRYKLKEKKMIERAFIKAKKEGHKVQFNDLPLTEQVRELVSNSLKNSLTLKDFRKNLKSVGITYSRRCQNTYTFHYKGKDFRGTSLSDEFSKDAIKYKLGKNRKAKSETVTAYKGILDARERGGLKQSNAGVRNVLSAMGIKDKKEQDNVIFIKNTAKYGTKATWAVARASTKALALVGDLCGAIPIVGKPVSAILKIPDAVTKGIDNVVSKIGKDEEKEPDFKRSQGMRRNGKGFDKEKQGQYNQNEQQEEQQEPKVADAVLDLKEMLKDHEFDYYNPALADEITKAAARVRYIEDLI